MVSKCRRFNKLSAIAAFALALFLAIPVHANIYPPKPAAHFYGDANGDTGVTGADIVQHNNFILSKPYTYDTLQPNNSTQAWNTCDMDSNRGCTGADNVILTSYLLSNGVSIGARPWELANLNLPLTDNAAATWIPFNIDLHSTHATLGPSGRPGISVVVEIDPVLSTITGQLSGRECNPVAGSRDQLAASNAQCTLAVTQTNWPVSAATGPTESGTYGLQVMGDGTGDLNLKVYTTAIPGLDIPATSTRLSVSFLVVPDSVSLTCPSSADENATSSCTITATGGSACAVGAATTCTGVTITGCTQVDIAAQGEAAGPGSCNVEVTKGTASDSKIITIDEVNQPPSMDFALFPTLAGTYEASNYVYVQSVYLSGNYAYVVDYDSGLKIINITNPAAPTLTGTYSTSGYSWRVFVSGNFAYVADDYSGLQIINVSNPTAPTLVATYNTTGVAYGVYVIGNYAYVADGNSGLQIINVTNPAVPSLVGTNDTPGKARGVYVSGNYAYVADGTSGLQIINVTNPAAPTLTGTYNTPGTAYGVYVSGNYAYMADGSYGLQIIDITNPTLPTLTGTYNTPGSALDVYVSGNLAYVADDGGDLQIINVSNPASPTFAGKYNTPHVIQGVYVSGNYAYVADYGYGLQIIDLFSQTVTATEYILSNYVAQVADSDIPQQTLTCSKNPSDTCSGNIVGCAYSFTPNGNQGGTNCVMGFRVTDNGTTAMYADKNVTISILDNNYAPTVSVDCPDSVDRNVETFCSLSASDADVPAQSLTCSIDPSSTCTGLTINGCATVTVPAQGERAPVSCAVAVTVHDSNVPIGTGSGSDTINIVGNHQPTIALTCPEYVAEPGSFNCTIAVDDDDVPTDTLTCSLGATDTCGGTLTGCTNYDLANSAGKSPSCVVQVVVNDNAGQANSTATDTRTVTFGPDPDSVALTCPSNVNEDATLSCIITATGGSSCTVGAATTCTGVTLTGCTQVDIAAQGELAGPGSCAVQVTRGTASDSKTIIIDEINQPPSINFALFPTLTGAYDTPGTAYDVYVSGNFAYVADISYGLQIIDITSPAIPTLTGTYDTPGYAYGVSVGGNYAYVADNTSGLQIINVSNPATPILAGTYDTPGNAYGVYVNGNYAYVADTSYGLQIIDISNPALPTLAGTYNTSGSAYDVYVSGNYAYVADGSLGLQIIDITNPTLPTLTGTYNTTGTAYGVAISGNYAYVADYSSGLQIINVSNPAVPTLIGTYNGNAWDVYVSGNLAYVADYDYGLQIIDVYNPAAPTLAGTYDTLGIAYGVYVSGDYAYVADFSWGLQIIDLFSQTVPATEYNFSNYVAQVTDSDIPQQTLTCSKNPSDTCGGDLVGCAYSFTPNGNQGGTNCVMGMRVTDNGVPVMYADKNVTVSILDNNRIPTVYVDCPYSVDKDVETSCALSASDADVPAQSLTCSINPSSTCTGLTIDGCATVSVPAQGEGAPVSCTVAVMVQDDNTPVGTGYGSDTIYIAGNNHPPSFITTPTLVGTYNTPGTAYGVYVSGNYAYVTDGWSLQIIDITNPAVPTLTGIYNTPGSAKSAYVSGNYAYVAEDYSGLQIIDITNPAIPTLTGTYDTPSEACSVYVSGNYAYVADWNSGLQIIDISNLAAPTLKGTYNTPGGARGAYVSGNYAYVADTSYGLQIIDITNPAAPILTGTYNTLGEAYGVYVGGNYAYVADYSSGLQIIDVSNPTAPTITGTYDTPGLAQGVYVSGNYVYVADGSYGLQIINVSNPAAPTLASTYDTPGIAYGVHVIGGYAYIANYYHGLLIIAWNPPDIAAENSVLMTYKAAVSDPDYIPQTLTCSINPNDTCGGSMVGCEYSFTPSAGQIGTSCIMGLRVTDDGIPAMYGDMDITVNIY